MQRRTFTATLSAAVLSAQSPNDTIRVAFVGVGNRGSYLLRHTLALPGIQVVALCDIEPDTLAKAVNQAGQAGHRPRSYADFRKLLDDSADIDAILIATPVDTHKMISIAALELGKHVYLEKPLAHTPEDARLIQLATQSAKGILQVGFQLRHDPNRAAAIRAIHSGVLGKVLYCQGYRHTGDLPRNTLWYFDRTRSGDNIVEQACHILDLFCWAIGAPPLRAFGSGGVSLYKDVPPGRTTMDNYSVIYDFPGDVRVNFSHIYFDPPGFSGIKERVFAERGAIDLATATWVELGKKGEIKLDVPDAGQDSTRLSLAAFFSNARSRQTPLNDASSALRSTLMAMMGRKSIYEKRIVTWDEVASA
jgi:predicted dehydrogenase